MSYRCITYYLTDEAITIFYKQNRAKKSSREIDVGTNPTIVQLGKDVLFSWDFDLAFVKRVLVIFTQLN